MVMVNVSVIDKNGMPVTGLEAEDFVLSEDGVEQRVAVVLKPNEVPADIGVLMDLSGSMRSDEVALRRDVLAFIDALKPDDCVYFLPFSNEIGAGTWGRPGDPELRRSIEQAQIRGYTPLYDALIKGIDRLERATDRCDLTPGEERRKALVVLTDGGDSSSTAVFAAAVNAAAVAEVPIFPVAVGVAITEGQNANIGASYQRRQGTQADARRQKAAAGNADPVGEKVNEFDHAGQAAQQSAQQRWDQFMHSYGMGLAESLKEIAGISGGKYIDGGESITGLSIAYNELLAWLRSSYVVGYYPPAPVRQAGRRGRAVWHELEVRTHDNAYRVYARPGYFYSDIDRVAAAEAVRAGIEMLQESHADESIVAFDNALDADPFNWEAYYYRGRALGSQGRIPEARDDFLAAARFGPGYGPVHEFVAISSADAGDFDTAWEHAIRAQHAGYDMSQRFETLRESTAPPADLEERLTAPRLYVGGAVVPDPEAQAVLDAVGRGVRLAISESRRFALVIEPELADYFVRLQINEVETDGRGKVRGSIELLEPGEEDPIYDEGLSLDDAFDDDGTAATFAGQLGKLADWLERR